MNSEIPPGQGVPVGMKVGDSHRLVSIRGMHVKFTPVHAVVASKGHRSEFLHPNRCITVGVKRIRNPR